MRRQISPHAARLRRDRTDAEDKFWQAVRNRQIDGFKFRFQHSLLPHIADFICLSARLIIEIDGGQHNELADARRRAALEAEGFRIIRFWNHDVLTNLEGVIEVVRSELARARSEEEDPPQPLPQAGGAKEVSGGARAPQP